MTTRLADDEVPEALLRAVERFAGLLADSGMPRMAARVFAYLLIEETNAATAAELGEELRVSPAAVSGAVRYLVQAELIERDREPGARRERYRLHDDIWYETYLRRLVALQQWETVLDDAIAVVGEDRAGASLVETRAFFRFIAAALPELLDRWRDIKPTA